MVLPAGQNTQGESIIDYGIKNIYLERFIHSKESFQVQYRPFVHRWFMLPWRWGGQKKKHPIESSLKEEGIKSEWHTPATALTLIQAELPRKIDVRAL